MLTNVFNLSTCEEREYTLAPREAVIAAYAQVIKKDWATWDYEKHYSPLVRSLNRGTHITWSCGDFSAIERPTKALT